MPQLQGWSIDGFNRDPLAGALHVPGLNEMTINNASVLWPDIPLERMIITLSLKSEEVGEYVKIMYNATLLAKAEDGTLRVLVDTEHREDCKTPDSAAMILMQQSAIMICNWEVQGRPKPERNDS